MGRHESIGGLSATQFMKAKDALSLTNEAIAAETCLEIQSVTSAGTGAASQASMILLRRYFEERGVGFLIPPGPTSKADEHECIEIDDLAAFAKHLHAVMVALGQDYNEVAERTGLGRNTLVKLRDGVASTNSISTLRKYLRTVGVNFAQDCHGRIGVFFE